MESVPAQYVFSFHKLSSWHLTRQIKFLFMTLPSFISPWSFVLYLHPLNVCSSVFKSFSDRHRNKQYVNVNVFIVNRAFILFLFFCFFTKFICCLKPSTILHTSATEYWQESYNFGFLTLLNGHLCKAWCPQANISPCLLILVNIFLYSCAGGCKMTCLWTEAVNTRLKGRAVSQNKDRTDKFHLLSCAWCAASQ